MDRSTFTRKLKSADFSSEVTSTTARGSSFTGYADSKVQWQGELSDAARDMMYWMDAVDVRQLADKHYQYIVNYRKYFPRASEVSFDSSELTAAASNYGTNLVDGVVITPTPYSKNATITNYAEAHNLRDLIRDKMDELSYALADKIDTYISAAVSAATETTSTVAGAMTLYGGNSVSADSGLTTGSVMTPSLVNKADVLLSGKTAFYWSTGTFTASSGTKNPWRNEGTDPFVLIIGPNQKYALRNSGQFTDAASYGSNVVISTGEIGSYLGIRVIVSNNVQSVAAGGTAPDGGSAPAVNMTRCVLMKGRAAYTFVWGRTPAFEAWSQGWADLRGILLRCDFAGSVVHADAVIKIDVSDN
jgi:N4-gp56 family major capsid protein